MKDTVVPKSSCLHCGKIVEIATSFEGHTPYPGAISVCIKCGHVMAFDDNMVLRNLNDQEMHDLAGDKNLLRLQKARGYVMSKAPIQK